MCRKYIYTMLFFVATVSALPVTAAEYEAEIIIFEYSAPNLDGEEMFTGNKNKPFNQGKDRVFLLPYQAGIEENYRLLSPQLYRLNSVYRRLTNASGYNVLLYAAWHQPQLAKGKAIHLENKVHSRQGKNTGSRVNGFIKFKAGRLLFVKLDVLYYPGILLSSTSSRSEIDTSLQYARINEERRIKLDELNYFDNPLFGIIVQVRRSSE